MMFNHLKNKYGSTHMIIHLAMRPLKTVTLYPPLGKNQQILPSSLQPVHTAAFRAAIAGNSSETRFLESPSGDSSFLPEPLQLICQVIYSQFALAIHQNNHQARRRFVEWAQNEIAVVPDFHKRILFSDEVHFWLNGYVNKQNCRIWSDANPQVYVETPLHPEKLTV
ncbi:hypothetical protein TNCV_5058871 [Trichonephila clavipes]|nr:hypothetical protein TNCV_5058871 [Trichonephila clavipes]